MLTSANNQPNAKPKAYPPNPNTQQYKCSYTNTYDLQLKEISNYINETWSVNSVENFYYDLSSKIASLSIFPNLSPKYHLNQNYHFFRVWDYLIFFIVDDASKTIIIYAIRHHSRNIAL